MSRLESSRTSLLVCACAAAMLSGCAVANPFATAAVDPASPVAAEVAAKARASRNYPTFADIPPVPTDVRPLPAFGRAATAVEVAGADLMRETAPGTWTLTGTEAFAGRARDLAGPEIAGAESTTAATEAFAKAQRARATPPPPPR
ncbi:hypothetical protein [Phenylobacterium sp.]|uniref:hypothetical protein n=1 Tax=Phenylobacterium sp. TaxID=1871053 RepID=UPI0030F46C5B